MKLWVRESKVLVGLELQRRGWKLFGWRQDQSDLARDYFDPEFWRGVATHPDLPGVVVVVGAGPRTARSHCGAHEGEVTWPIFQANPKGASWHVEWNGRIVAKGSGIYSIYDPNDHMEPYKAQEGAKLARICDRIEEAAHKGGQSDGEKSIVEHVADEVGCSTLTVHKVLTAGLRELHRWAFCEANSAEGAILQCYSNFGAQAAYHLGGLLEEARVNCDPEIPWSELLLRIDGSASKHNAKFIRDWLPHRTSLRIALDREARR